MEKGASTAVMEMDLPRQHPGGDRSFLGAMAVWPFSGGGIIAWGPPCRNP